MTNLNGNISKNAYEGTILDSLSLDMPMIPFNRVNYISDIIETNFPNISTEERDALRHYYGTREISDAWGSMMANLAGYTAEISDMGFRQMTGENWEQSQIDLINNAIAIDHKKRGVGKDFHSGLTLDSLNRIIDMLEVPPPINLKELKERHTAGMQGGTHVDPINLDFLFNRGPYEAPGMYGKQKIK